MELNLTKYVRKPFAVEAIEITKENILELAEFIGTVAEKEDGTVFIQVDRKKIPNIFRVFPGFWLTKMGGNYRCYSERIFKDQFTPSTPSAEEWMAFLANENKPAEIVEPEEPRTGEILSVMPEPKGLGYEDTSTGPEDEVEFSPGDISEETVSDEGDRDD